MQNAGQTILQQVTDQIGQVVLGHDATVKLTLTAMLAGGHVLFEDVPGVGKTTLVETLAKTLDLDFRRIQFTPDLMPSDIVGGAIFNQQTAEFEFRRGPLFTPIVLADEINRATPRTQAALLEAMGEKRITIDGQTYNLDPNFFVLATQNATEFAGTYPLPEAQLDRFLMRLHLGYPEAYAELALLMGAQHGPVATPILTGAQLSALKAEVANVTVSEPVADFVLRLVRATRHYPRVRLGISPRGGLALVAAARALAFIEGRNFVLPDDVQTLVPAVFGHRLLMQPGDGADATSVLAEILQTVLPPD
ncbi:AAA family ATPase [Lacticaseibacillus brantae]|uniref:Methanol dehydrogenase regulatory protein n=1 Tax=Lacticaseibacillus brantae DSM 23927 TaxID=1423727 RepID=A0A0R2AZ85_9LACO|nr:MoxR family ATPase [Lacticaseibacillus brantae]KRM72606.1 methanol dehydrogenase regulatory protein [Lacticaseibacillus brantae DSM 23927]